MANTNYLVKYVRSVFDRYDINPDLIDNIEFVTSHNRIRFIYVWLLGTRFRIDIPR